MVNPGDDFIAESDLRVLREAIDILKNSERIKGLERVAQMQRQDLENFTNQELAVLKENLARQNASDPNMGGIT